MSSDWQYIQDEMGGWGDDGLPNFTKEPGFYAETDEEFLKEINEAYGTSFQSMDEYFRWKDRGE